MSIKNKKAQRPYQKFTIKRIQGIGYTILDPENILTSEVKEKALMALSTTGISKPEDSPFQCFYLNDSTSKDVIISFLEDDAPGEIKCRQFWFKDTSKVSSPFVILLGSLVFFLGLLLGLSLYYFNVINFVYCSNVPSMLSDNVKSTETKVNSIDPETPNWLPFKTKQLKKALESSWDTRDKIVKYLDQESFGLKEQTQTKKDCIKIRENIGFFNGKTELLLDTLEVKQIKDVFDKLLDLDKK